MKLFTTLTILLIFCIHAYSQSTWNKSEIDYKDSLFTCIPKETDSAFGKGPDKWENFRLKSTAASEPADSFMHIHNDRYISLQLSEEDFGVIGTTNEYSTLVQTTRTVYNNFTDKFDFIIYILNHDAVPDSVYYAGICYSVSNAVEGINKGIFNLSGYFPWREIKASSSVL